MDEKVLKELLLKFATGGDTLAFDELVRRFDPEMHGYVRKVMYHDHTLADDAAQNAWLIIFRRAESYDSSKPIRPWLFTIAHNAAVDALRRNSKHQALSLDSDNSADVVSADNICEPLTDVSSGIELEEDRRWLLETALPYLSAKQASTIRSRYFDGLSCREAAEKHGISVGTVKSRVSEGLRNLRKLSEKRLVTLDPNPKNAAEDRRRYKRTTAALPSNC